MDTKSPKLIVVPRQSWGVRAAALLLLVASAGLLYYVWWGWGKL